jgi:hypothetical protein
MVRLDERTKLTRSVPVDEMVRVGRVMVSEPVCLVRESVRDNVGVDVAREVLGEIDAVWEFDAKEEVGEKDAEEVILG